MHHFPKWFYIGLALNISGWAISWLQVKPLSYFTFFVIWLGFILVIDGINFRIRKSSLLSESKINFVFLFIASSLFWWYFEIIVRFTQNWYYFTDRALSVIEHQLLGTLYFSTVIPAVLEVTEFLANKRIFAEPIKIVRLRKRHYFFFLIMAILSFILPVAWPSIFFGLIWLSLFFILDYFNYKHGFDSLTQDLIHNKWNRIFYLGVATLICGLFWELWNSKADPHWAYEVPFVGSVKIFEMPVLGYLGYIPFGWEVFAFYSFLRGVAKFPEVRFFNLSKIKIAGAPNKRKIIISLSIVIAGFILLNGIIEQRVFNEFFAKPLYQVGSLPANANVLKLYQGEINNCVLSIQPYSCLVTTSKNYYILVNQDFVPIRVDVQNVFIDGKVIDKNQETGMDYLVVTNIYSAKAD